MVHSRLDLDVLCICHLAASVHCICHMSQACNCIRPACRQGQLVEPGNDMPMHAQTAEGGAAAAHASADIGLLTWTSGRVAGVFRMSESMSVFMSSL